MSLESNVTRCYYNCKTFVVLKIIIRVKAHLESSEN